MKLLILGATGPTGRQLLDVALEAGDEITVLARTPGAIGDLADRLTVVEGNARSSDDVTTAMDGQDAIISALGRSRSLRAESLFTTAAAAVLEAATRTGVQRLVWLSSFGVGPSYADASAIQKATYRTLLRSIYADKAVADERIRTSALDWTIVYPTRLTNGPRTGTIDVGEHLTMKGNPTISRADVADFMHRAAHHTEWVSRSPVITESTPQRPL